ncbi:hypothetical protein C1893_09400 [Pseudomonas sp. MPR-ANC1]|uniref:hypothetical protein n=1 Tax=Pseudomonas sp. MPR-ANC1 TaxID=2075548 RepID=UPI000CD0432F|nr:hypothetical protein [Pseudomonas sp. MPR-ANC1]POA48537.1 hypothetical protein C1893_09400 [Pseudomonas sp. MPR-ANC1]
MSPLFKFKKLFFLSAALLAASTSVSAEQSNPVGDWWIIYGNGVAHKNIMYVADATSVVPSQKTKGATMVAVTLVYEEPGKPMIDVYNLEAQCSAGKVRFINGQSIERLAYTMRHLKVSDTWQAPKEFWIQQALKFACTPGSRNKNEMVTLGKMEYMQMIQTLQQMFFKLAPVQEKSQMMDDMDTMLELEK